MQITISRITTSLDEAQFSKWSPSEKAKWLKDHPYSRFGTKVKGMQYGHTHPSKVNVPKEHDAPKKIKDAYDKLAKQYIRNAKEDKDVRPIEKQLQQLEKQYPDFFAHYHHKTNYLGSHSRGQYKHKISDLSNYFYDVHPKLYSKIEKLEDLDK